MQAVQVAVIAAAAAKTTAAAAAASSSNGSSAATAHESTGPASITPTATLSAASADSNAEAAHSPKSGEADSTEAAAAAAAAVAFPASGGVLDRTERLACSLGRMVGVVEEINATQHSCDILLMAGALQNDMIHVQRYL
jgi:hypothetical protein